MIISFQLLFLLISVILFNLFECSVLAFKGLICFHPFIVLIPNVCFENDGAAELLHL